MDGLVRQRLLAWAPVVTWAALIFALSAQPGLRFVDDAGWDLVVRKAGHMGVFGILAALTWRAVRSTTRLRPAAGWSAVAAIAYAVSDEAHQALVADRTASLVDVAIDAAGVVLALVLVSWLARRREGAPLTM